MRDTFAAKLLTLARSNRDICIITGDLGFGSFNEFRKQFPDRFINAGVAEQNMTGLATGLAMVGKTVFTYSIGNFPVLRCLEQIRNDACYHEANIKVVTIGGFSYGALGISHHATEDISIVRSLPNITVIVPSDKWEAGEAVEAAAAAPGAFYLRLDKSSAPEIRRPAEQFVVGKARTLRQGTDITLIGCGGIVGEALRAADRLAEERISCRVISMHTIKPIDRSVILEACRETEGIVTIEEHTVDGGLGGAVAEVCLESAVRPRVFHRIGLRAGFSSIVGSQEYLRSRYDMDASAIVSCVKSLRLQGAVHG